MFKHDIFRVKLNLKMFLGTDIKGFSKPRETNMNSKGRFLRLSQTLFLVTDPIPNQVKSAN